MNTSTISHASPSPSDNSTNSGKPSVGLIVGLVVGLLVALLIILIGGIIALRRRQRRERSSKATPYAQADISAESNAASWKKKLDPAYDDSLTLSDLEASESDSDAGSSTASSQIWEDRTQDMAAAASQPQQPRPRETVYVHHDDSGWRPPLKRKPSLHFDPENVDVLDVPPGYEEAL
ncbi:hypothetical protein VNI00_004894 [Paramarasmius palmivorus]|uniref:Uncharacterized protein n=1 Tax=Paramarasmius palmivorus TaxID=297713 RepID=A0AAW0DF74_9AGAR